MKRNEMKICSLRNENPLREQRTRRVISTAKATPTTRDRGIGDWNQRHYDRFTLSKTDFLVCRFPRRYIDQSLQSSSSVLRPEK